MANDTHGASGAGWYGFDLDGTLAKYDGWKGISHIGEPVKPMIELMKRMHDEGKVVKIMTARVAPCITRDGTIGEQFNWLTRRPSPDPTAKYTATQYIQDWCEEVAQLGFTPEIVYQKDHLMLELYDDRVKQVIPNTGILVEDELARTRGSVADLMDYDRSLARTETIGCGLIGCFIGVLLVSVMLIIHDSFAPTKAEAEAKLIEALREYRESAKPNFVRELFTGSEEQK